MTQLQSKDLSSDCFFTGVKLSTGHGGLCFTPVKEMPGAVCCPSSARAMPLSGRLSGRPVSDYLEYIFSDNPLKKALGIAALNALSTILFERGDYDIQVADTFDEIEPTDYGKVTVVGALVPIIKKLIASDSDFSILELDPKTLKEREMKYFVPADMNRYRCPLLGSSGYNRGYNIKRYASGAS